MLFRVRAEVYIIIYITRVCLGVFCCLGSMCGLLPLQPMVFFNNGAARPLTECINNLLASVDVPIKIRALDSAPDNRKLTAHEFGNLPLNVIYMVVWCTIHINHAITSSGMKQFGAANYNSLYSCALLMQIGTNFYQLVLAIPKFVQTHCNFIPTPPPEDIPLKETMGWLIMSLGYLDGQVFTDHPRGIKFVETFRGNWANRNVWNIYNMAHTIESFELAHLHDLEIIVPINTIK